VLRFYIWVDADELVFGGCFGEIVSLGKKTIFFGLSI